MHDFCYILLPLVLSCKRCLPIGCKPQLSCNLGILPLKSCADFEMGRVVPDEEVRNFNVQISSAEPVFEFWVVCWQCLICRHYGYRGFEKAVLTLKSFSRNF